MGEYTEADYDEFDPDYDEPEDEDDQFLMQMECPFCDGTGETGTAFEGNGQIRFDCPECGGTGWY